MTDDSENSGVELVLPPVEYMRLVCGDKPNLPESFDRAGRLAAQGLRRFGLVEPGARLLDIGCGCGRVARCLLDSPIAAYVGFDRHRGMIEWAESHITSRDDRFQFEHVDVRSPGYEERDGNMGTVSATDFVFPYCDGAFTGVFAVSVFTHIDLPATSHYLAEAARVLVPGGMVHASFFIDETTGGIRGRGWLHAHASTPPLPEADPGNARAPFNYTIREDELRESIRRAGLDILHVQPPSTGPLTSFLLSKPEA